VDFISYTNTCAMCVTRGLGKSFFVLVQTSATANGKCSLSEKFTA